MLPNENYSSFDFYSLFGSLVIVPLVPHLFLQHF